MVPNAITAAIYMYCGFNIIQGTMKGAVKRFAFDSIGAVGDIALYRTYVHALANPLSALTRQYAPGPFLIAYVLQGTGKLSIVWTSSLTS